MNDIIEIYGYAPSSYVRTARMVCLEKGVDHRLVDPGDIKSEAYRRELHPFGKMPAMKHGDLVLFETSAIARYIDEAFDGPSLQPGSVADRAKMHSWISSTVDYFYDAMIRRFALQFIFPKGPNNTPDRSVIDAAAPQIKTQLQVLDRALERGPYLAGDQVSLADLFLAPILGTLGRFPDGQKLLADFPSVVRAATAMSERDSFRKVHEGLS